MITVKNLSLQLQGKPILNNVNVAITKGRITIFIGASGAGKTSLIKSVAQVYKHYVGDILLYGQDAKQLSAQQRAQAMGVVFQHGYLFPHLTVLNNCVQPQVINGIAADVAHEHAFKQLEQLHIAHLASAYPGHLSGGQQQRVAIARALCLQPAVLLLDEPSSALDPHNTKLLATLLKNLNEAGVTIALCSHDVLLVKELLDRVYLLENGAVVEEADFHAQLPIGKQITAFLAH